MLLGGGGGGAATTGTKEPVKERTVDDEWEGDGGRDGRFMLSSRMGMVAEELDRRKIRKISFPSFVSAPGTGEHPHFTSQPAGRTSFHIYLQISSRCIFAPVFTCQ